MNTQNENDNLKNVADVVLNDDSEKSQRSSVPDQIEGSDSAIKPTRSQSKTPNTSDKTASNLEATQKDTSRRHAPANTMIERVVSIRRVNKVVKGGRNLTFTALVVVGDGKGRVGSAIGRGASVPDAVRRGNTEARSNMQNIIIKETTIPHEIVVKYSGAKIFMKPAAPGTGVIAGGGIRTVMEAVGITDVLSKSFGSPNPINMVRAAIKGLSIMRDPVEEVQKRRQKASTASTLNKNQYNGEPKIEQPESKESVV